MNGDAWQQVPAVRELDRDGARRRYCAPSLAKGPMLAVVTAADSVVSGVRD